MVTRLDCREIIETTVRLRENMWCSAYPTIYMDAEQKRHMVNDAIDYMYAGLHSNEEEVMRRAEVMISFGEESRWGTTMRRIGRV